MTGNLPLLLVTLEADGESRRSIEAGIDGQARVVYLADTDDSQRRELMSQAPVLLARNTAKELGPEETAQLKTVHFIQFVTAGVDHIPLAGFGEHVAIAANGGAYAQPMAEHALAMTLAALKRLFIEHGKLAQGTFDQFRRNRMLAGTTCGILGFGGISVATARLMRALGVRVHAINRRGATEEPIDWIGRPRDLDHMLAHSDVLVVSVPLTPTTRGMLGSRELALMKPDAILVNLARGEVIDEAALFEHLQKIPTFTACLDAWWVEPVRHGSFRMDHPFLSLSNVIGSPHNSASVFGGRTVALERAVANIRRVLGGEVAHYLVPTEDRMM